MATVEGFDGGMVPVETVKKKPVKREPTVYGECSYCDGAMTKKDCHYGEANDKKICNYCRKFFGMFDNSYFGIGVTTMDRESTLEKLDKLRKEKYLLVLKTQGFVSPSGLKFTVELGDVFPVGRIGASSIEPVGHPTSWSYTKSLFTATINVAGCELVLYPHEFGSMSFLEIMVLRKDGEYMEAYLTPDDTAGYFTPTPEVKKMIKNTFERSDSGVQTYSLLDI